MSFLQLPWSYAASIITFGVFFFSLNMYIFTLLLNHPFASPWWIGLSIIGLVGFIFSLRMAKKHQEELIARKIASDSSAKE